jgi:hypothetical protein
VYAGAAAGDPKQGVVYVVVWNAGYIPQITHYQTPTADGAARILSEQDGVLQVQTSGGSSWRFDRRTGEFK